MYLDNQNRCSRRTDSQVRLKNPYIFYWKTFSSIAAAQPVEIEWALSYYGLCHVWKSLLVFRMVGYRILLQLKWYAYNHLSCLHLLVENYISITAQHDLKRYQKRRQGCSTPWLKNAWIWETFYFDRRHGFDFRTKNNPDMPPPLQQGSPLLTWMVPDKGRSRVSRETDTWIPQVEVCGQFCSANARRVPETI